MSNTQFINVRNVTLVDNKGLTKRTLSPNSKAESVIFTDGESLQFKFNNKKLTVPNNLDAAAVVSTIKDGNTTSYALKVQTNIGDTKKTTIIPIVTDVSNPHMTRKEASDIFFSVFGARNFSSF